MEKKAHKNAVKWIGTGDNGLVYLPNTDIGIEDYAHASFQMAGTQRMQNGIGVKLNQELVS
jgi:hypothetical protein